VFVAVVAATLTGCSSAPLPVGAPATAVDGSVPTTRRNRAAFPRDLVPYAGLGAWIDVFNYAPAYQPAGTDPPLTPHDLDELSRRGIKTLYLQAARWDDKMPAGIVDPPLLGAFLRHAHELGLRVVGWYLPRFVDVDLDVNRATLIHDFSWEAERFDGLAIDIEYTEGEPDVARRNDNLVQFSQRVRAVVGDEPLGAIVLSAVHLEVINQNFWPAMPYAALRALYDVWMPMAYWTLRRAPYDDGYAYVKESVDRLRADLGDPGALMAPIGGIADTMTEAQMDNYAKALVDTGSIGGSFYNWNTTAPGRQAKAHDLFATGAAAALAPVPAHSTRPSARRTGAGPQDRRRHLAGLGTVLIMELDQIDALRASVKMLRGTNDAMIDEARVRSAARLDDLCTARPRGALRAPVLGSPFGLAAWTPGGPRHIDEALADDGEIAGTGFVIPADPPPSSTY